MTLEELKYELRLAENVHDNLWGRMVEANDDTELWNALYEKRRNNEAYIYQLENLILEWR